MLDSNKPRLAVVGATASTLETLKGIVRNDGHVVGVIALDAKSSRGVSGYATPAIESFCLTRSLPFSTFTHVNSPETISRLLSWEPDWVFAVGFSQLVGQKVLSLPRRGVIGFHPTCLPLGRGRAPLAWLTFRCQQGAATFFQMTMGMDDGPILVQEPFEVGPTDHAHDVGAKVSAAIGRGLDRWMPSLNNGSFESVTQDESAASYTGIRRPLDGLIDWNAPVGVVGNTIRAAARPHCGAYTYAHQKKLTILHAADGACAGHSGVPGRILRIDLGAQAILVQAGEGQLWLSDLQLEECGNPLHELKVGQMLGYIPQHEVHKLHVKVKELEQQLSLLRSRFVELTHEESISNRSAR